MTGASDPTLVVEALFRYPVKSMQGEAVGSLTFSDAHARGDREWAVADPEHGVTLSAKRHGALLEARARTDGDRVVVTLPDGTEVVAGEADADAALSNWLGRPVELRRPGAANLPIELLADPVDDDSAVTVFAGPRHHFADTADAHLLTAASLRAARHIHPHSDWDLRRFRPSALVAGGGEGFIEDGWVGGTLEIGDRVVFGVVKATARCSLPIRAQPGLERDATWVPALRDHHDYRLGIYAVVRRDGTVRTGDPVRPRVAR